MNQDWPKLYKERRYGILLTMMLLLTAGPPILLGFGLSAVWFDSFMSALMLAAIISLCFERQQRFFALLLGVPSIVFSLISHVLAGVANEWALLLGHLCEASFLLSSAILIVKLLFSSRSLSWDSILGAICGYLFLGLGWAVIYSMIEKLAPGSLNVSESLGSLGKAGAPQSDVMVYYSFVTLTTVGYGDITPLTPLTRTCAWIEAMTGQFYLAVIVAGLVSMLASAKSTAPGTGPDKPGPASDDH